MISTHKIEVVPVHLEPHPNADSLSLVRVFDHYVCAVRTEDWKDRTLGAYCPPDSVMPDLPEYAFLQGHFRIKAKKLRGVVSQGLLIPAPEGVAVGDDVAERLGILHYDPPVRFLMGQDGPPPPMAGPHYDIENWFRYGNLIPAGVEVEITEKLHGTNFRATWQTGKIWVAARSRYRKPSAESLYWQALEDNPWLLELAQSRPNAIFYGEIFGCVQDLKYGAPNERLIRVFDVFEDGRFLDVGARNGIVPENRRPPVLYSGPYADSRVEAFLNGPSVFPGAKNLREGIVIRPLSETFNAEIGRVILKAVSPLYLERA
jgi:RNA ligase (TIGR02306 family)